MPPVVVDNSGATTTMSSIQRRAPSPFSRREMSRVSAPAVVMRHSSSLNHSTMEPFRRAAVSTPNSTKSINDDPNVSSFISVSAVEQAMRESFSSEHSGKRKTQKFKARRRQDNASASSSSAEGDGGALQFLPALQQEEATSWDAIFEEKKDEAKSTTGSVSQVNTSAVMRRLRQQSRQEAKSTIGGSSSKSTTIDVVGGGSKSTIVGAKNGRMARFASLFSSRVSVNQMKNGASPLKDAPAPASPHGSLSTASSGYVGWPGTQDRRGVVVPGSYSDASASSALAPQDPTEVELQQAAEREMMVTTEGKQRPSPTNPAPRQGLTPLERRYMSSEQRMTTPSGPIHKENANTHLFEALDAAFTPSPEPTPLERRYWRSQERMTTPAAPVYKENASDFQLNAVSSSPRVVVTPSNTRRKQQQSLRSMNFHNLFPENSPQEMSSPMDPWAAAGGSEANFSVDNDSHQSSSGILSKTSSAYLAYPTFDTQPLHHEFDPYNSSSAPSKSCTTVSCRRRSPQSDGLFKPGPFARRSPSPPQPRRRRSPNPRSHKDGPFATTTARRSPNPRRSPSPPFSTRRLDYRRPASPPTTTADHRMAARRRSPSPPLVKPQPPTREALKEYSQPITRRVNGHLSKGYRGLIDKTKEVPSLMDHDSDTSSKATTTLDSTALTGDSSQQPRTSLRATYEEESDVFDGLSFKESDVFDNLSTVDDSIRPYRRPASRGSYYPQPIAEETPQVSTDEDFKLVLIGGGLAAIQSDTNRFRQRTTASDFDDALTNSDYDDPQLPAVSKMMLRGTTHRDSSLSGNLGAAPRPSAGPTVEEYSVTVNRDSAYNVVVTDEDMTPSETSSGSSQRDFADYCIPASRMKKVLRKYRQLSDIIKRDISLADFEVQEDEHKAFCLLEMRSRIMETDIERGLERRGGTVVVDDLVTTRFARQSLRVRDAVIVAKAWRDGATPKDVILAWRLTRKHYTPFCGLEPRVWTDDADFVRYTCPSLGPRMMRGPEMFTIGDCQSILLKLTNERCIELRRELNNATRRQIEAEDMLKQEAHVENDEGMMTEAEMAYLDSMEEVKTISKKLVASEHAFALVRDRIQKLVSKYESLLQKIETGSAADASSIVTYESSVYDEDAEQEAQRAIWARRAQRAEVKAELAAREALMAKQEARMIQEEKERELEVLQQRLQELQSEASSGNTNEQQHQKAASVVLERSLRRSSGSHVASESRSSAVGMDKQKRENAKQRFRDRINARKHNTARQSIVSRNVAAARRAHGLGGMAEAYGGKRSTTAVTPSPPPPKTLVRSAGEEMCLQLDFYERSLRAVAKR